VITFKLSQGMTRERLVDNVHQIAPKWHTTCDHRWIKK